MLYLIYLLKYYRIVFISKEGIMSLLGMKGTIVPLVTPFTHEEEFDVAAMGRLIEFILEQGADNLMTTALTGEGPLLTEEETVEVWHTVFEITNSRVPIIPAIISTTTRQAISLARVAEKNDAPAVMVAPIVPELYAGRSQNDVYSFYADVADAVALPIILFNYPTLTGVDFVPQFVERLAEIENIQAIKESTADTKRIHGIKRLLGERIEVICGAPNVALESLSLGCDLWLTGVMNNVPRSAQQLMYVMEVMGDLALARDIYFNQILPIVDVMAKNLNPTGTIKAGICARGVEVGRPRRPGHHVGSDEDAKIHILMDKIVQAEADTAEKLSKYEQLYK